MCSLDSSGNGSGCYSLDPDYKLVIVCEGLDPDYNEENDREREMRIGQVFELQKTLDDLSRRVDSVKEENLKLRSENLVLGQYIENLMAASALFQSCSSTAPNNKANSAKGGSR